MPKIKSEQADAIIESVGRDMAAALPPAPSAKFQRSGSVAKRKPDPPGRIAVRIIHVDPQAKDLQHKSGLRREDILIEGSTVADVFDAINNALFGSGAVDEANSGADGVAAPQ